MVDHEKDAVAVIHVEIEDLMLMPRYPLKFVRSKRRMPPIGPEKRELFARQFLNLRWKAFEFALEPDGPSEDHRSWSMSLAESNSSGSIGSFLCSSTSAKSLPVGLRAGTVAANRTGLKGTSTSLFFNLAFTIQQGIPTKAEFQSKNTMSPSPIVGRNRTFAVAIGGVHAVYLLL